MCSLLFLNKNRKEELCVCGSAVLFNGCRQISSGELANLLDADLPAVFPFLIPLSFAAFDPGRLQNGKPSGRREVGMAWDALKWSAVWRTTEKVKVVLPGKHTALFIWKNRTESFSVFQLRSSKGVSLRLVCPIDALSLSLKSKVTIYSADWTVWLAWFTPNKKQQSSKDCKLLLLTTDGSNWSLWTATCCQQVILSVAQ